MQIRNISVGNFILLAIIDHLNKNNLRNALSNLKKNLNLYYCIFYI